MKGLLISDDDMFQLMDDNAVLGKSKIIPAGIKKDGTFRKDSKIADAETFNSLRKHMHDLMVQAGVDITSGGVHLNPFQYKKQTACTFCPFLSVCQFEPTLETNEYHRLQDMKEEDILMNLRNKNK